MYLHNPVTGELKISDKLLDGFEQVTSLKYKSLLVSKKNKLAENKQSLEINGNKGIKGKSTKITGKKDDNLTVDIDSETGLVYALQLKIQDEALVPTVEINDNSKRVANTEWVKLQEYVNSKTLEAYVINSSLTDKTIDVNLKSILIMDETVSTQTWVQQQGYLTSTSLNGYATQDWVQQQGYLTSTSLNGYATQGWVQQQGYLTSTSLNGYATQDWVQQQGYLTSTSLNGYATQGWVQQQGYLTSTSLNGYATQDWVQQQGYLTSASLSGYATQEWVSTNYQSKLNFTPVQQGGVAGMDNNKIYLGWGNKSFRIQVDSNPIERIILASNFNSLLAVFTQSYTHGASVDWFMAGVGTNGVYLSCVPSHYAAGGGDQRSAFFIDDSYTISGRNSNNSTGNAFRATSHTYIQGKDEWSENPHYYLLSVGDYENVTGVVMEYVIREEGTYLKKLTKEEYLHILESFETYTDKFLYYNKEISELYEGELPLEFKKLCSIRVKKNLLLCTDKWATKPYSNIMTESELNIFEELRALWHYEVCNDITTEVNVKNLPEFLVKKLNINLAKL